MCQNEVEGKAENEDVFSDGLSFTVDASFFSVAVIKHRD